MYLGGVTPFTITRRGANYCALAGSGGTSRRSPNLERKEFAVNAAGSRRRTIIDLRPTLFPWGDTVGRPGISTHCLPMHSICRQSPIYLRVNDDQSPRVRTSSDRLSSARRSARLAACRLVHNRPSGLPSGRSSHASASPA